MKPVIIHSQARAELEEAMAFYEQQRAGLGLDLQSPPSCAELVDGWEP